MTTSFEKIRVLIIADDPLVQAGLTSALANERTITIVGQESSVTDFEDIEQVYQPDILLWDLGNDPTMSIEKVKSLNSTRQPVLALLSDNELAPHLWDAGVAGILVRDLDAPKLATSILAVFSGLMVIDRKFVSNFWNNSARLPETTDELTPRELGVLRLLANGLPNKIIAQQLGISEHTVKFHVNSILSKLGAHSRTEAVTKAARLGLILL